MNEDVTKEKQSNALESSWFRDAYVSAQKFYEKDSALDSKDRLELSNSYRSIARAQLWGGWLGFTSVFLPPFFYRFYKTNTIRGVNVPRNFGLGIIAMILATKTAGDAMYSQILNNLSSYGINPTVDKYGDDQFDDSIQAPKSSQQRQYDMLTLVNNGGANKWAAYFYMTYTNPDRRFPNPATKLQQLTKGEGQRSSFLNQRDPMGLYTRLSDEKKEGVPKIQQSQGNEAPSSWDKVRQESNSEGSSWNRVRQGLSGNGDIPGPGSDGKAQNMEDDPFYTPDHLSQSEFDALVQDERKGKDNYD
ncbi:hypothetical protein HG535_0G01700 [Zygotorulaspora mrakii]|uniref:Uncharacterized protein n=1 Tax=Zygotorulaspora mrakii TaxID=42260 RepID=A0A7H9B7E7_ZYGMR|nr:uncharacterized protein HG535_0G01700 [Zygotorulaspora mrakii]QLG74286.1 hypothetical protein HG535_0G01700 [Zygotorulaspora mrakii]